jgi:hypothetical protein
MRSLRNITHILLALAILSTGMPLYQPGDANRDARVDLADAILRVQGVAQTAEQPAAFRDNLEEALVTLSVVSGFRKVIKTGREQSSAANPCDTRISVSVSHGEPGLPPAAAPPAGQSFLYQSIALAPLTPPPLSRLL